MAVVLQVVSLGLKARLEEVRLWARSWGNLLYSFRRRRQEDKLL